MKRTADCSNRRLFETEQRLARFWTIYHSYTQLTGQ
jgi:hypothetical protein